MNEDKRLNHPFEQVEIFLRVMDRLPDQDGDGLNKEILKEFSSNWRKYKSTVNLGHIATLIDVGEIVPDEENVNPYLGKKVGEWRIDQYIENETDVDEYIVTNEEGKSISVDMLYLVKNGFIKDDTNDNK